MHWLDSIFCLPEHSPRAFNVLVIVAFAVTVFGTMYR